MRKRIPYELYDSSLSIGANASIMGCSESAVRKYIQRNNIDRRYDANYVKWKRINDFKKLHPDYSLSLKSKELGYSINTIRRYELIDEAELDVSIRDTDKISYFDIKNNNCIKSISYNQDQILRWIMRLYNNNKPFDCDLTYSKGVFYKNLPQPQKKYDKYPQVEGVHNLNEADLLPDEKFSSIVYDLPFLISDGSTKSVLLKERFSVYMSGEEAYRVNDEMLLRAYRLLKHNGLLVIKTMDCSHSGQQYWLSDYVLSKAIRLGLILQDKFILLSKQRILPKIRMQHVARKYHSYFFVFKKINKA